MPIPQTVARGPKKEAKVRSFCTSTTPSPQRVGKSNAKSSKSRSTMRESPQLHQLLQGVARECWKAEQRHQLLHLDHANGRGSLAHRKSPKSCNPAMLRLPPRRPRMTTQAICPSAPNPTTCAKEIAQSNLHRATLLCANRSVEVVLCKLLCASCSAQVSRRPPHGKTLRDAFRKEG